jgi:hypothetical protein
MIAAAARAGCPDVSAETLDERRPRKTTADAFGYLCELGLRRIETGTVIGEQANGLPGVDPSDRWQLLIHARSGSDEYEIDGASGCPRLSDCT